MAKYTIGLIIENKNAVYADGLYYGARAAIHGSNCNLVLFSALLQQFDRVSEEYMSTAFKTAASLNLDAYIVSAGTITVFMRDLGKKATDFLKYLPKEKTIVMEDEIEGYHCIYKDNKPGIHAIMKLLIEERGLKKIGFISGPQNSFGGRVRAGVFFEEMKSHGLFVPESAFAYGDFRGFCHDAIEQVITKNPDIEALVCANDLIALTAYDVLRSHGLEPGKDVAVTGYDDFPQAAFASPPLTTVRLSSYMMGYNAAQKTIEFLNTGNIPDGSISGTLVVRDSTGGHHNSQDDIYSAFIQKEPFPVDEITTEILRHCLPDIRNLDSSSFYEYVHRVMLSVKNLLNGSNYSNPFVNLSEINERQVHEDDFRLDTFQEQMNSFLRALVSYKNDEFVGRLFLDFNSGMTAGLNSHTKNLESDFRHQSWLLSCMAGSALLASSSTRDSYYSLLEKMKELGFSKADILLFDEPAVYTREKGIYIHHRLYKTAGFNDDGFYIAEDDGTNVHCKDVMRRFTASAPDSEHTYGAIGLYDNHQLIGLLVAGFGNSDMTSFYYSSLQVTYTLRYIETLSAENELIDILNRSNSQLSEEARRDVMTGLLNRRGFRDAVEDALTHSAKKSGIVFYMDMDFFKEINDVYGHDEGDNAIRCMAVILKNTFTANDALICRYGGDEFVALIFTDRNESINAWKDKLSSEVDRFNESEFKAYRLSISVGAAAFDIHPDFDILKILGEADSLLYEEKKRHHAGCKKKSKGELS